MLEQDLRKKIESLLDGHVMLQRIEFPRVPDLFFQSPRKNGWIEFKIWEPERDVPFRPGQLSWIRACVANGGNVMLMAYSPRYGRLYCAWNNQIAERYTAQELTLLSSLDYAWLDYATLSRILLCECQVCFMGGTRVFDHKD